MKETRDMLRKHCRVFYGVDSTAVINRRVGAMYAIEPTAVRRWSACDTDPPTKLRKSYD